MLTCSCTIISAALIFGIGTVNLFLKDGQIQMKNCVQFVQFIKQTDIYMLKNWKSEELENSKEICFYGLHIHSHTVERYSYSPPKKLQCCRVSHLFCSVSTHKKIQSKISRDQATFHQLKSMRAVMLPLKLELRLLFQPVTMHRKLNWSHNAYQDPEKSQLNGKSVRQVQICMHFRSRHPNAASIISQGAPWASLYSHTLKLGFQSLNRKQCKKWLYYVIVRNKV